jgi:hypothetical protein
MQRRWWLFAFFLFSVAGCSAPERQPGQKGSSNHGGGGVADLSVDPTSGDGSVSIGNNGNNGSNGSGGSYNDLGRSDSGTCMAGQTGTPCASPIPDNAGCQAHEDCGPNNNGNGLDDDCNGKVDDGCPCVSGSVEKCFLGPPLKHGVGACQDGTQTCGGTPEFPSWGDCMGSIGPTAEACDKVDNDCNGCVDDGLCCGDILDCPSPGDPRIPAVQPYTDVAMKGELFYTGSATTWSWKVVGGPCDQLFSTTTGSPPTQSFTLTGPTTKDASSHYTLSGDYTVTMTATAPGGMQYSCTWIQHVIGPGVRFELCWDKTGPTGSDLDLHVHRPGTTTQWFADSKGNTNTDDCFYEDCNPDSYQFCGGTLLPACTGVPSWSYTASNINECSGAPATQAGDTWSGAPGKSCPNPRLDIDNVSVVGKPENTNIDNPKNNDSFRAMVHYYGNNAGSTLDEHPIVNIYCGGNLKASYGQAPNQLTGFNKGYGFPDTTMPSPKAQIWRVADVQAAVDGSGNTTDCTVTAIHPTGSMGYSVTNAGVGF